MKYYDLVFEVGIGKQYFSWVLQTVGLLGCSCRHHLLFWLQLITCSAAFYWLSFCLSTVMTSFSLYLSH